MGIKKNEFRMDAPSNIALIKYWGKKGFQLPRNPSISMTLSNCKTIMDVEYEVDPGSNHNFILDFSFESKKKEDFEDKILAKIVHMPEKFDFLQDLKLKINALNTFPHSSGIASSASSMACLSKVFARIYFEVREEKLSREEVSGMARCFSGSACRSLFENYSYWGKCDLFSDSSDEYACRMPEGKIHKDFKNLKNAIIVIDQSTKKIATTHGHELMEGHPYAEIRYQIANEDFRTCATAIQDGDWKTFKETVRREAYQLHGLMMTGNTPYSLLRGNSIEVMGYIDEMILDNDCKITYTLDAGPNIHLLYHEDEQAKVETLLEKLDEKGMFQFIINDSIAKDLDDEFYE